MPGPSGFWLLLGIFGLIYLLSSVSKFIGFWHRLNRHKFFRKSFGEEPFPITEGKIELVEVRLAELMDGWRPWISQLRTFKAEGNFGPKYREVRKTSVRCREEIQMALFSAGDCDYFCSLPYFDQFRQLMALHRKGL